VNRPQREQIRPGIQLFTPGPFRRHIGFVRHCQVKDRRAVLGQKVAWSLVFSTHTSPLSTRKKPGLGGVDDEGP